MLKKAPTVLRQGPKRTSKWCQNRRKKNTHMKLASEPAPEKAPWKGSLRIPSRPSKCGAPRREPQRHFSAGPLKSSKRAPKGDPKRSQSRSKPRSKAAPKTHCETSTPKSGEQCPPRIRAPNLTKMHPKRGPGQPLGSRTKGHPLGLQRHPPGRKRHRKS